MVQAGFPKRSFCQNIVTFHVIQSVPPVFVTNPTKFETDDTPIPSSRKMYGHIRLQFWKVRNDGHYEGWLRYDPDLQAKRDAELAEDERRWKREKAERRRAQEAKKNDVEEAPQDRRQQWIEKACELIARDPADAQLPLNYLYLQAVAIAPQHWDEIEIRFESAGGNRTSISQHVRLRDSDEFEHLPIADPMDVIDVIERFRNGMQKQDTDVAFRITDRRIEPIWAE